MVTRLTPKQQRFFDYLKAHIDRWGAAPSLREAADDLEISHSAVAQFINILEAKGLIKRAGRYSRNISVIKEDEAPAKKPEARDAGPRGREVPIVGKIAAGLPLYAQEEWDGSILVDRDVFRSPNLFALRVKGDSMKDAGILEGDLVICEARQYAANGEIVVALFPAAEEATIKRFFLKKNGIELHPENQEKGYRPKRYGFGEVLIQGKVIGVHRGPDQL